MNRPSVAWVESPLQALCAVEAHQAGLLGDRTRVFPRAGLPALDATFRELDGLGPPPGVTLETAASHPPRAGGLLAVGDAFSGLVQMSLLTAPPARRRRLIVVDDGLATMHLLELLAGPAYRPLLRARAVPGPFRRVLGVAAALRFRAAHPVIFTGLPVPPALAGAVQARGVPVVTHGFGWLRSRPAGGVRPTEGTVVLGSSLVRNGLVAREGYLAWLTELGEGGPVAYFPHRRETPADLELVRSCPGVRVYETGAPAELTLRGLEAGQRVVSLPSTAVSSLRVILSARGVPVEVAEVPEKSWTAKASPALRAHLRMFAETPGPGTY